MKLGASAAGARSNPLRVASLARVMVTTYSLVAPSSAMTVVVMTLVPTTSSQETGSFGVASAAAIGAAQAIGVPPFWLTTAEMTSPELGVTVPVRVTESARWPTTAV